MPDYSTTPAAIEAASASMSYPGAAPAPAPALHQVLLKATLACRLLML